MELEADAEVLKPGQTVNVRIAVKNGPCQRWRCAAVLLEIEAEIIDPRYANWGNVVRRSPRGTRLCRPTRVESRCPPHPDTT
ncbi:MAG: hypothetical protein R3F14_02770 [Polyangiaceae bacterium]